MQVDKIMFVFWWGNTILNIDYIAKKQVKNISDFIKLINENFQVAGVTNEMIAKALDIKNNDLEGVLQFLSAKNSNCECIVTNDTNFYKQEVLTLNRSEFVEKFILR